jgi:hypothetical protein
VQWVAEDGQTSDGWLADAPDRVATREPVANKQQEALWLKTKPSPAHRSERRVAS